MVLRLCSAGLFVDQRNNFHMLTHYFGHDGPGGAELKACRAVAALTKVDVRRNMGLDKASVDALRAAAPETCEIRADH